MSIETPGGDQSLDGDFSSLDLEKQGGYQGSQPSEDFEKKTEFIINLENKLETRGISDVIIGENENLGSINVLSMAQSPDARQNTEEVMDEIGIEKDVSVEIVRNRVFFNENTSGVLREVFPNRNPKQWFDMYTYMPKEGLEGKSAPVVIYSHGGAIRPETSLKSPFLATIKARTELYGQPLILTSVDHRGSSSHEEKTNYCLEDRVADMEVLALATIKNVVPQMKEKGIDWNGEVIVIGNSMGGHVSAVLSNEIHPDKVILPQPAAYSKRAHFSPLGPQFSEEIRVEDSWKLSPAFDTLAEYLSKGGDVLIIGAEEDNVIPDKVTQTYMEKVTFYYVDSCVKAGGVNSFYVGYLSIKESHIRTTEGEITGISEKLFKREKDEEK